MVDITEELKKIIRRQDTMQKSLDTLNADRNMLEDIVARLSAVEQALHLNKSHQTEVQQNIKAEIKEGVAIMENGVQEVKDVIKDNTVIVKAKSRNVLSKIMEKLKGGDKKK